MLAAPRQKQFLTLLEVKIRASTVMDCMAKRLIVKPEGYANHSIFLIAARPLATSLHLNLRQLLQVHPLKLFLILPATQKDQNWVGSVNCLGERRVYSVTENNAT